MTVHGKQLSAKGNSIDREVTNNQAEYVALIKGLETAHEHDLEVITIYGDSELIINQVTGEYNVSNDTLAEFQQTVRELLARFESWSIDHVGRGRNHLADDLAYTALQRAHVESSSTGRQR